MTESCQRGHFCKSVVEAFFVKQRLNPKEVMGWAWLASSRLLHHNAAMVVIIFSRPHSLISKSEHIIDIVSAEMTQIQ
jgi:hypothetical protein